MGEESDGQVSHGICPECLARELLEPDQWAELRREMARIFGWPPEKLARQIRQVTVTVTKEERVLMQRARAMRGR